MTGRYQFFQHRECEYFPCHATDDPENFNCLFCYCPLYMLGERCGGRFRYTEAGIKDCTGCILPHQRENYARILRRWKDVAEQARAAAKRTDGRGKEKQSKKQGTGTDAAKAAARRARTSSVTGRPELTSRLKEIGAADAGTKRAAEAEIARLVMPPGSLGKLIRIAVQLAGITGRVRNGIHKKRIYVLCADNGVTAEGVSSAPSSVTLRQAINMTRGKSGMAALAAASGAETRIVDVGIDAAVACPEILDRKIRRGTGNIARGSAMEPAEALQAVGVGMELAKQAKAEGVDLLGVGEMGIGNTTTAAAALAALTGCPAEKAAGRGGGVTDAMLEKKIAVIKRALEVNAPEADDPIDVLTKVGGLEIAAMCGVFLGAAHERLPAVIDGFISAVAALCAVRLAPETRDYLFPSHASAEPGYRIAMEALSMEPWLLLDMRLGEGSGCPMAFQIIEAACAMMNGMGTFDEAGIDDGYLKEIRRLQEQSRER